MNHNDYFGQCFKIQDIIHESYFGDPEQQQQQQQNKNPEHWSKEHIDVIVLNFNCFETNITN